VAKKGLGYLGMGVSGGEEGARNGMPHLPKLSQHAESTCITSAELDT